MRSVARRRSQVRRRDLIGAWPRVSCPRLALTRGGQRDPGRSPWRRCTLSLLCPQRGEGVHHDQSCHRLAFQATGDARGRAPRQRQRGLPPRRREPHHLLPLAAPLPRLRRRRPRTRAESPTAPSAAELPAGRAGGRCVRAAHPTHGPQRHRRRAGHRALWRRTGQPHERLAPAAPARPGLALAALGGVEGVALAEQGLLCEGRRRRAERHIEAHRPGELICLDSFYVGNLKGVGRIWQVTAIDAVSAVGWALPPWASCPRRWRASSRGAYCPPAPPPGTSPNASSRTTGTSIAAGP